MYNITYFVIHSVTVCHRWHSNKKNTNLEKMLHLPNTEIAGQLFSMCKMGPVFKTATSTTLQHANRQGVSQAVATTCATVAMMDQLETLHKDEIKAFHHKKESLESCGKFRIREVIA